ncbi:hypothetical protein BgiBS90_006365 [Biomphalaria glabrata]|nr:hypothetical protein BgiBS90_006365 [Biomphalaria glabrata]
MAKPVTEITSQSLPESTVSANDITTLHLRITKQTATSRPTIEQETNRYIATTKTSTFSRHGTDSTAPNYTMYSKSVTNDTLLTATSRTSKVIPTDSAAKIHSTNNSSGKTSSILIPVFSTIGGVLLCVGLLVFCLRRHRSPSHFKLMYITDDALVDNEQHEAKYFPL